METYEEKIKHIAYDIYCRKRQAGFPDGSSMNNDIQNWLEAEALYEYRLMFNTVYGKGDNRYI